MDKLRQEAIASHFDVEFNGADADRVVATVHLNRFTTVKVELRRETADGEDRVSCSCQKPQDVGMPCKHAHCVFEALRRSMLHRQLASRFRSHDTRWYDPVWHTATWREQYATDYPPLEVQKHAPLCISVASALKPVTLRRLRSRSEAQW